MPINHTTVASVNDDAANDDGADIIQSRIEEEEVVSLGETETDYLTFQGLEFRGDIECSRVRFDLKQWVPGVGGEEFE